MGVERERERGGHWGAGNGWRWRWMYLVCVLSQFLLCRWRYRYLGTVHRWPFVYMLVKVKMSFTSLEAHSWDGCGRDTHGAVQVLLTQLGIILLHTGVKCISLKFLCSLSALFCKHHMCILLGLCEGLRQRSVSPDAYGVARKWFSKLCGDAAGWTFLCSVVMETKCIIALSD